MQDAIPCVDPELTPPLIHGAATLAHFAAGLPAEQGLEAMLRFISRPAGNLEATAALLLDCSAAHRLRFFAATADALQKEALARGQQFRVAPGVGRGSGAPLRVLALMAPGDLMVNTPLDFLTQHLHARLDLLFVRPGEPLPRAVPEHDVAFFAVSESDPATLARLAPLFARWPRPALNHPTRIARLSRDGVARAMAALPGCTAPAIRRVSRLELGFVALEYPVLLRPFGSHAGEGLERLGGPEELEAYLRRVDAERFYLSRFIDYRGADRLYRKYRLAFVDGVPHLCHMAASSHWMVHYLNAGMELSAEKRAMEAEAMAEFDTGFARRHAQALRAIADWVGLEYFQIDCADLPDGRLLVFEADVAAIVHMLDPPELFPYKPAQMRRVIDAFGAMLRTHAGAACRVPATV